MRSGSVHRPKPKAARYFDRPADLIYDPDLELVPNLDHVLDDNVDRYPSDLRDNPHRRRMMLQGAIAEADWPVHLEKMYAFWSSVMLTSGRYKGNPVAVHQAVTGIQPDMFARWLDLFEATAASLFEPAIAHRFATSARRIAESLKLALFFRADQPWTEDLRRPPSAALAKTKA